MREQLAIIGARTGSDDWHHLFCVESKEAYDALVVAAHGLPMELDIIAEPVYGIDNVEAMLNTIQHLTSNDDD